MGEPGHDVDLLLREGEPVWEAVDFELACPRCGYNLQMLTRPRCPECGLDFEWRVVLDRASSESDFLFEHHWRSRPIRSWLTTVWRSLRPFRFWRSVSIHHRIHVGPLWFTLLAALAVFCGLTFGAAWLMSVGLRSFARGRSDAGHLLELAVSLALLARMPFTSGWMTLWMSGLFAIPQFLGGTNWLGRDPARAVLFAHLPPFCLLAVVLGSGLRTYLRLPRPWLIALVAAGVGFLAMTATFFTMPLLF